ncbi:ABC transporter ATP-binding protein [Capillibacterium thermochitinicola]|uniref:ABC transporter ATP-binding protein n=1 Tax=Capillibacterium thermochitinicola TaxID=2699427 RepID=A0A8J6LJN2_9FIRM|nr:ABC transporter ATP-binding protein [Capillibacterium thermochitinicola]MBA2133940.1 ABC transporter ATP-binding protein [Capillibacterium thermochitinicola]
MFKQLFSCIGEYKKESLLAPLTVTGEVMLEVLIPLIMADLIDKGIVLGRMDVILRLGGILVVAVLISLAFGVLAGLYASRASAGFAANLRKRMYYAVQDFSFSNIDRFSTASLVTRLTTDVTHVEHAYQMVIRVAVRSPMMLLFSLLMSFRVNPGLSLIFLVVIPFLGLGLYLIARRAFPIFHRVFRAYDRLNRVVQENLRGIRVVKSFVREEHETRKFRAVSQQIHDDFILAEKILALNAPLMQSAIYLCLLLISWVGARMVVATTMTTGQLVSLFSYSLQILMSLMMLSMVFVMLSISRASAERIVEVMNEKPDLHNPVAPVREVKNGEIRFEQVSFSYSNDPDHLCLVDINLQIEAGQTVGIIGGTGSGKTTLVQLIPRLYDVTKGAVYVGGVDVRAYDLQALREQVAMVLQKNVLFSGTIKENLRWGNANATDEELVAACRLAQADEFIRALPEGYDTYLEQGGVNLSGGQKQRLCIARALLKKPRILILDDSTSAVDTKTDALIRKAFRERLPEMTKLIIAQRVASVMDADLIVVMDQGRVVAAGTHEELLATNQIYREVYTSQLRGGGGPWRHRIGEGRFL